MPHRTSATTRSQPHYTGSGNDMMLGSMLGQLIGLHQQLVSLHHDANEFLGEIIDRLEDMPERTAEKIAEKLPKPPEPPPPVDGKVTNFMKSAKELAQALLPLTLLAAVAMGKVTWSDAMPFIRQAMGLH